MFIAGVSEFFLIASLIYAASLGSKQAGKYLHLGYLVALGLIAVAAFFGSLRFLGLTDNVSYHVFLSYMAKHLAMPIFVLFALWHNLRSSASLWFAKCLLFLVFTSCLLNLQFQLVWLSDAIIVTTIVFAASQVRSRYRSFLAIMLGLILLLSKPLWSAIMESESLSIGIFHLCLGIFFMLLATSLNAKRSMAE